MEPARFDELTRELAIPSARRHVLRAFAALLLGIRAGPSCGIGHGGAARARLQAPSWGKIGWLYQQCASGCCTTGGHTGIDIWTNLRGTGVTPSSPRGNPVRAAADGLLIGIFDADNQPVTATDPRASILVVEHEQGQLYTLYAHMANADGSASFIEPTLSTEPGKNVVRQGQLLGYQGNARGTASPNDGLVTHLHFEVKTSAKRGHQVDPSPYLGINVNRCSSSYLSWHSPFPPSKPGGMWIAPATSQQVTVSRLGFAARAYSSNPGDPPIDHVNFTLWWPDYGPRGGPWLVGCTARQPSWLDGYTDDYRCTVDLETLGVPAGTIMVSFDVYDQAGNYHLAPHGTRTITYQPAPECPAGLTRCGSECVDLRTNWSHCGKCDNRCGIFFGKCCDGVCGCDGSVWIPGACMGAELIC